MGNCTSHFQSLLLKVQLWIEPDKDSKGTGKSIIANQQNGGYSDQQSWEIIVGMDDDCIGIELIEEDCPDAANVIKQNKFSESIINMERTLFLSSLLLQRVKLQDIKIEGETVTGKVAAINLDAASKVNIRYSFDGWKSFAEEKAKALCEGRDKLIDLSSFSLNVPLRKSLEFAVSCETINGIFWDNKNGENYKIERNNKADSNQLAVRFDTPNKAVFIDRLKKAQVHLKKVYIHNNKICLVICSWQKNGNEVGVRYTFDAWKSHSQENAVLHGEEADGEASYKIWIALINVPTESKKCQFAIFMKNEDGIMFWDNHHGCNYVIYRES